MSMSAEQTTCEDLKAFERRLTEVISSIQPATKRWRRVHLFVVSIAVVFLCAIVGACYWLQDPDLYKISLFHSLFQHPLFTISAITLVVLLLIGGHKKSMTSMIITSRARSVLVEFNMSCDDNGKLILRPRPVS